MTITWLAPHRFSQRLPSDIDYRIMLTFLEFHEVLMQFVLFKLYHSAGLKCGRARGHARACGNLRAGCVSASACPRGWRRAQ